LINIRPFAAAIPKYFIVLRQTLLKGKRCRNDELGIETGLAEILRYLVGRQLIRKHRAAIINLSDDNIFSLLHESSLSTSPHRLCLKGLVVALSPTLALPLDSVELKPVVRAEDWMVEQVLVFFNVNFSEAVFVQLNHEGIITYLAHESGVGCGREVKGQHPLFELVHRVDYEVVTTVVRPVDDVAVLLLVDRSEKVLNERRKFVCATSLTLGRALATLEALHCGGPVYC
jgi:hypothetical protein